jgi:hypothetical protein
LAAMLRRMTAGPTAVTCPYRTTAQPTGHQRKSFCVKGLVGASSVVCPCIAVMGLVPSSV